MNDKAAKSIVMIDDDEVAILIGEKIIGRYSLDSSFQGYNSAVEVLKEFSDVPKKWPDIIFVDINMPFMNGWEFVDSLSSKLDSQCHDITICMLTSSMHSDDIEKFTLRKEVNLFFNKPLTEKNLDMAWNYTGDVSTLALAG